MVFIYLSVLLAALCCMLICDWRWGLTFFHNPRRACCVSVIMVGAFLVWDALGIATGSFYRGNSPYMTGIELAPELPLEEPIFLFFLTYLTMNLTASARLLFDAPARQVST